MNIKLLSKFHGIKLLLSQNIVCFHALICTIQLMITSVVYKQLFFTLKPPLLLYLKSNGGDIIHLTRFKCRKSVLQEDPQ